MILMRMKMDNTVVFGYKILISDPQNLEKRASEKHCNFVNVYS